MSMSKQEAPALPGELWRVVIRDTVCVVLPDAIRVWWCDRWDMPALSASEREEAMHSVARIDVPSTRHAATLARASNERTDMGVPVGRRHRSRAEGARRALYLLNKVAPPEAQRNKDC